MMFFLGGSLYVCMYSTFNRGWDTCSTVLALCFVVVANSSRRIGVCFSTWVGREPLLFIVGSLCLLSRVRCQSVVGCCDCYLGLLFYLVKKHAHQCFYNTYIKHVEHQQCSSLVG